MQRLEVSGAVRPIYGSLGFKRLRLTLILSPYLQLDLLYGLLLWGFVTLTLFYVFSFLCVVHIWRSASSLCSHNCAFRLLLFAPVLVLGMLAVIVATFAQSASSAAWKYPNFTVTHVTSLTLTHCLSCWATQQQGSRWIANLWLVLAKPSTFTETQKPVHEPGFSEKKKNSFRALYCYE